MSHGSIDLKGAAKLLHMDENELRHFAQRGEIVHSKQGDSFVFPRRELDEWAQRRLMGLAAKKLSVEHLQDRMERRRTTGCDFHVAGLLRQNAVRLDMTARNRGGVLRDLTDLAESTGLVYDPLTLFAELQAREEAGTTAMELGVALPHPKYHDPYLFAESFIAFGRTIREVFFGSPDGKGTDLYFLVCCSDASLHLHVLSRLCLLMRETALLENLRAAGTPADACEAFAAAENSFLDR